MCGIIGVAGVPDASRVTYLGLYSLQHRGQESAGVVTVDGAGVARSHRGMGLVSDVFSESVLAGLPGDVAIGHTRYSTAGSSVLANAQPILAGYHEGPLALAHNGNLTNAEALRSDLVAKGSIFQTSSDSEVLIHLIARSEAREPEDRARRRCLFAGCHDRPDAVRDRRSAWLPAALARQARVRLRVGFGDMRARSDRRDRGAGARAG
jgi:amidophosphoribosyltransferase